MSGTDRLTDEQLDGLVQEGDAAPWVSEMARELLAHRRASQAAPAPSDGLREALEPFAKAADIRLCGEWRDDQSISRTDVAFSITFGDLRRARAAISASPAQEGGK